MHPHVAWKTLLDKFSGRFEDVCVFPARSPADRTAGKDDFPLPATAPELRLSGDLMEEGAPGPPPLPEEERGAGAGALPERAARRVTIPTGLGVPELSAMGEIGMKSFEGPRATYFLP